MKRILIALLLSAVVGLAPIYAQSSNLGLRVMLQSAATSGNGTAVDVSKAYAVTIYCQSSGTTSAGVITIEEADDPAYAGTWSSLTTITASTISGGAAAAIHLNGVYIAVRARISSTITGGGTMSCDLLAN